MPNRPAVNWDDLRFLLAVHRRASHGGAGHTLKVDATTVGRRVAALERSVGARLFDRTRAGLAATEAGAVLVAHAEKAEAEVLAAERELGGADTRLSGTVRVTAGDGIVHYFLVPALEAIRRTHPGILLELHADTRALDLARREADVAIRLVQPTEPSLVRRRYGKFSLGLYASRGYLDRRGTPRSATDLATHDFIGFDSSLDRLPQMRWLRSLVPAPRWVVRATSTTAQALACAEGLGIAILATFVARAEPRLVAVTPSLTSPSREVWVVVHQDLGKSARIGAVLDWLAGIRHLLAA